MRDRQGKQPWQYASLDIGSPMVPYSTGHKLHPQRVRGFIAAMVEKIMAENWLPFTWPLMGRYITPRAPTASWQSPFDLDASERITRFGSWPSSQREFPYPWTTGAVDGFMPMLDAYSMAFAWAETPFGPGVLTPVPQPWAITYPGLQKQTG